MTLKVKLSEELSLPSVASILKVCSPFFSFLLVKLRVPLAGSYLKPVTATFYEDLNLGA